jgi:hypothetical protein
MKEKNSGVNDVLGLQAAIDGERKSFFQQLIE